jgi:3-oxoacyl-(acyl-carrier-protein) synthase
MAGAIGWGALAAVSLVIGALLALVRSWSDRVVGLVLAFGAGALISELQLRERRQAEAVLELADFGVELAAFLVERFPERRAELG